MHEAMAVCVDDLYVDWNVVGLFAEFEGPVINFVRFNCAVSYVNKDF